MNKIKIVSKTETVSEFLARGGEIQRMKTKHNKKAAPRAVKSDMVDNEPVDYSFLPEALRIRYGIKE